MPHFLGQDWSSVFLQPFHGAATIWPKTRVLDWPRILTDPTPQDMRRLLFVGQNVTFPKLHMISNRIHLERAIARGRERPQDLRKGLVGGDSSVLETYSPEWFQFLHAADSPMAGTPYESGAEDDVPRGTSIRRALTMPAEPHAWRHRGSMLADGTLTSLAHAEDSWDAEPGHAEPEREPLEQDDGAQYDVDREHNARGDAVDVDRSSSPSDL
ncbi:hypothetical protein CBS14141_004221 [Malassezia furfur]|nr:hypothetical protein CBS14141_004221 [Malassezia furfur]